MSNKTNQNASDIKIGAFYKQYKPFQKELKSFLYRILANRQDAEDIHQDCFVKAFEKHHTFKGTSSLKVWCFSIAHNLAYDVLRKRNRWSSDTKDKARDYAESHPEFIRLIEQTHAMDPEGKFVIKEHIDHCFTCISKSLIIEQQISLILKDIYAFKIKEVALIINKGEAAVKHYVRLARKTMIKIYDDRCSLVNKNGMCHQCAMINHSLNPEQKEHHELINIKMFAEREHASKKELYKMRTALIKSINPLYSKGTNIQEIFMSLNRKIVGEIDK
ncbi:RNA polymerase sigma factor [Flavivirga aquimarina]|uniref:RNA polymerase sigma factor n=1 Tax=Flavivirga aquimarina TaxID=2027862 RepID=A0ABT8W6T0_9FLAO|nr:RNA polymerase sigma factor [Flavivirga aquimarina]MDO5968816.1 RNA polymerase sigma factor [Flavivirga aquimarina]